MTQKFQVIVSDPPWVFSDSLTMSDVARGAAANYNVMTISDIKSLNVKDYADPDGSVLALWVPSSLLQEGLDTMKAWGFNHKQTYVWVKNKKEPFKNVWKELKNITRKSIDWKLWYKPSEVFSVSYNNLFPDMLNKMLAFGMGRLFRQTHEICLVGTNNNKIYKHLANKSQRSVSFGENLRHSAKPEHLQDSLDIMFPTGKKLEMFARRIRPGWTCIGNEVCNGEDITVSLAKLI